MKRWVVWLSRSPRRALLLFFALTALFAAQLWDFSAGAPGLRIETAVELILPDHDEERSFYDGFRARFGNDEMVLLVVIAEDALSPESIARVRRIGERAAALDGIERVLSVVNALDVRAAEDGIRVEPLIDALPADAAERAALRARVLANPVYAGNLVSRDGRASAIVVTPEPMGEVEFRRRGIDEALRRIAAEEAGDAEVVLGGAPPVKAATSRLILRDALRSTAVGILVSALVGVFAFRSAWGALLPILSVGVGQLWALGAMAFLGRPLSLVTSVVPTVVNAVGIAYGMHLVAELEQVRREGVLAANAAWVALDRIVTAVLLCALTTVAGFLSLCTSPLPAIREFGIFCAIGTTGCMVAAVWMLPCWLALRPPRLGEHAHPSRIPELAERLARFDLRHRGWIYGASIALAAVAVYGVTRIEISTSLIHNFREDHPLRIGFARLDEHLGGSNTLQVVLDGGREGAFESPDALRHVQDLQRWIAAQPEVGHTLSIADWVALLHRALQGDDPAALRIPDSKRLVEQLFYFFWDPQLEHLVDESFSAVAIETRVHAMPSAGYAALVDRIEARLAELPDGFHGRVTGNTVLVVHAVDDIATSQALSLATGLFSVGGLLVLYFRSLRVGLLALVPNVLPVLWYFGALGLFGVTLNPTTSLVACLVLGVAVDDTLHGLARFQAYVEKGLEPDEAAVASLRSVARPILLTSVVLCGGLFALATSELRHQVEFGVLAAGTLAFAAVLDVTLTPALASRLMARRKAES